MGYCMRYLAALIAVCSLLFCAAPALAVEELSWGDLVPPDAQPLTSLSQPTHDLALLADTLSEEEFGDPAVQSQPDAPVVAALNGREVKLPGYIVPLGIDPDGSVSEFLLVPYFGIRQPDGLSFDVVVESPIPHSDPLTMMTDATKRLEARIADHPEQWFWVHRRWK